MRRELTIENQHFIAPLLAAAALAIALAPQATLAAGGGSGPKSYNAVGKIGACTSTRMALPR